MFKNTLEATLQIFNSKNFAKDIIYIANICVWELGKQIEWNCDYPLIYIELRH